MRTLPAIPPANAAGVLILNSENGSYANFTFRADRLAAFLQYFAENRQPASPRSAMPGISGAAHYGLDCIFFGPKPPRFPAYDILAWIKDRHGDPAVTVHEVEDALGRWAGTVSQLFADGTERA